MLDSYFLQLAINVIRSNQDMINELRHNIDRVIEKFDKEMTWLKNEMEKLKGDEE